MQTYVPLHNHGHGSTLDGFAKELEHAKKVSKDKGVALGLTDHGTCAQHGALKEACATYGIKPIYGIEAYFVDDVKLSKERKDKPSDFSHGCLWAIDDKGLENLWTLSTISTDKDHMYYKPRMDFELLSKYSEGLAVSDGCLLAEVARAINDDDFDRAEEYLQRMVSIFGRENVFIELHTWQFCNPIEDSQVELNRQMTKANHGKLFLAKKLGLKTIAVNDAHYAEKEDYVYHELVWNSHTSKGADAMSDSLSDTGESLGRGQTASWLMNEEEVRYWLAKHGLPQSAIDESIQNTWDFAQRCTAKIESRIRYPLLTGDEKKDTELFNQTIEKGFKKKVPAGLEEEYRKRVEYEKDVILEKNFEGYFNVVSDFCRYTKESDETGIRGGIPGKQPALLGPARGSAGGSLVSYLMDITEIDPVKHGLPFERFLSRSRGLEQGVKIYFSDHWPLSFKKSSEYYDLDVGDKYLDFEVIAKEPALVGDYPDIDSDFPSSFSGKIIDYLRYKYGNDSVAKVGTAQTSQIRNVFKDLARAHNVEFRKANTISRLFPEDLGPHYFESEDSLEELFEEVPELREYSELLSQIAPHLNKMLGRVRQYGSHASGYIVTNYSLIGKTPMRYKDGELVTQFDLSELAKCGFVKYDILKIKALDIIQDALETAVLDKVVGKRIIDGVPVYRNLSEVDDPENYTIVTEFTPDILYYGVNKELDDPGVWKGTREGDSLGIFQLETSGGTRMAQNMQIQNLEDAAVLSAVNRPGMTRSGLANKYFKRRRGDEPVEYPHPQLEKIVGKTYGFFVFQEDVMRLFTEMAGYSLEESDAVRKTVTKKDFEGMLVLKERFLDHVKASPTFLEQMPDKYASVEDCFNEIWAMMEHTVAYSFNSSHSFAYAFVGGWQAWIKRYFLQYFLKASVSYNPSEIRTYAVYGKKHGVQILPPDINKSGQGFVVEGKNIRAPLGIIANVGPRAEQEVLEGQPWSSIDDFEARASGRHAKRINVYKNLIIAGAFDSLESDRKALLEKMYRNKGKVGEYGDVHLDVDISTRALISKAEEQVMGYSFSFNPIEEVADSLNTPAISTVEGIEEVAVGEISTVYGKVTNIRPYKSKSGTMAWVTLQLLDDTEISITMFADLFQQVSHLFELSDVILVRFSRTADFRDQPSYVANEMINMTSYLS